MKYEKATNQMVIIYAFLDVVLMLIYQRIKDLKWILKQRRTYSLDMAWVLKGIRLFDTDTSTVFHSRDVIFDETESISEQGTEEVENQPLVEVECENISSDDDEATEPRRSPRRLEKLQISMVNGYTWVYIKLHQLDITTAFLNGEVK